MTSYVVSTAVNGTFEVPDDLINTTQTSLNLIGRGVTNYGQAVAQNEINLLANFAGPTPPLKPLLGQLWFNSTNQTLQLYTSIGTWAQMSLSSDLSSYALASDLDALETSLVSLASNAAMKTDLANYVTANELYHPTSTSRIVPYGAGGTGLSNLGLPNQVLAINAGGTGYTFVSPSSFYAQPYLLAPSSLTLNASQLGCIVKATASGITITLPAAGTCIQGTAFTFSFPLTTGTITIKVNGNDTITNTIGTKSATITLTAGEEMVLTSDGAVGWGTTSYSRVTATTQPVTDNSTNIATTAFINNYLSSGSATLSASMFLAAEGVNTTGSTFTTGYSFINDGLHDTGMFSPLDGNLHLYANGTDLMAMTSSGVIVNVPATFSSTLAVTGTATAVTPAAGDSSTKLATTAFVATALANKLPFTPVQQGGGASQNANKVYLGWDGARLRCQIDSTDLGGLVTSNEMTTNVNNLQAQINTKAAASQPYAYTGINQSVSFWDITANGTLYSVHDIWAFASDERLKENIEPIQDALAKIHMIAGVLYNFSEEAQRMAGYDASRRHMGFLAGPMEKVAPEIVGPSPFDIDKKTGKSISGKNYKTIQYEKVTPLLLEGIKAVDNKVDALAAKVNAMDAKLNYVMEQLSRIIGDDK